MIKESIYPKDITIINIYESDIRTAKYIKQILTNLNDRRDNNAIIVGKFQQWIDHPERKLIREC